jgi:hypothetical protein
VVQVSPFHADCSRKSPVEPVSCIPSLTASELLATQAQEAVVAKTTWHSLGVALGRRMAGGLGPRPDRSQPLPGANSGPHCRPESRPATNARLRRHLARGRGSRRHVPARRSRTPTAGQRGSMDRVLRSSWRNSTESPDHDVGRCPRRPGDGALPFPGPSGRQSSSSRSMPRRTHGRRRLRRIRGFSVQGI